MEQTDQGDITEPSELDDSGRTGLAGWFGRPVHLEARRPFEQRALRRSPLWRGEGVPAGEGRPLLLIPGFMAGPKTADPLAHVLRAAGWQVRIAGVGRNSGPAYHGVDVSGRDLAELADASGQPVTTIGHSRGGQYARILAVRHPEMMRQVIVVGTPLQVKYPPFVVVKVPAEVLDRAWRAGAFGPVDPNREQEVDDDRYLPFPEGLDFVSIWSRNDGIVDWRMSRESAAHDIEVSTSHLGLISSIPGVEAVAAALSRQQAPPDLISGRPA